eukprot:11220334-Lingulodinium_polyedra.AAC.1
MRATTTPRAQRPSCPAGAACVRAPAAAANARPAPRELTPDPGVALASEAPAACCHGAPRPRYRARKGRP